MKKYLALLSLLLLFAACKKDYNKRYIPLNVDLKRNYSFKEGSYWIYRDSLSGREDSFYVSDYRYASSLEGQDANYEFTGILISERNVGNVFSDSAQWYLALTWGTTVKMDYYHWPSGEHSSSSYISQNYPFIIDNYTAFHYPKLILFGKTYSDVTSIYDSYYGSFSGYANFYFKDSIGLVKIDFSLDTTHHIWELERYHINF